MACVMAPMPPLANQEEPAGCSSPARANQQHQAAAGGPRSEECSENSARGDGGAQQFGLEIFRDQIGDRHRSPAQQAVHVFLAQFAEGAAGVEHAPQIA